MTLEKHSTLQKITVIFGFVAVVAASYGLHLLPFYPQWQYVSPYIIVLTAVPSYFIVIHLSGFKKGLPLLILLSLFGLGLETVAVATGWPYGFFRYQDWLGPRVLGLVPWTVAFAWPPLVLGSVFLTRLMTRKWWDFLLCTALLVWFDLIFDPGAVSLGFWHWLKPGEYYGVPLINFLGWIASGLVASLAVTRWLRQLLDKPVLLRYGAVYFWLSICFWTALAGWQKLGIPLLLGLCLSFWVLFRLAAPPVGPPVEQKLDKLVPPRPERYYRQRRKG